MLLVKQQKIAQVLEPLLWETKMGEFLAPGIGLVVVAFWGAVRPHSSVQRNVKRDTQVLRDNYLQT